VAEDAEVAAFVALSLRMFVVVAGVFEFQTFLISIDGFFIGLHLLRCISMPMGGKI
jgi:hypothetical protein